MAGHVPFFVPFGKFGGRRIMPVGEPAVVVVLKVCASDDGERSILRFETCQSMMPHKR